MIIYRLLALVFATATLTFTPYAKSTPTSTEAIDTKAKPFTEATFPVAPTSPSPPMMLFNFEGATETRWTVEDDRVMGGRSKGFVEMTGGTLVFTGEVVTEGGGFSSARASRHVDLSGYDGIELRVRGGGRTFQLDIDDGTRSQGREVTRRGPVPTMSSWETVRVPFSSLKQTAHGEPVSAGPLDLSAVMSIGVYIADGKDGPFRLEIEWIRAYRQEATK